MDIRLNIIRKEFNCIAAVFKEIGLADELGSDQSG